MTPDDLATLPAWAAAELRRQAEEIAALRAALEGAERRAEEARSELGNAYSTVARAMAQTDYGCGQRSHLLLLQARARIVLTLGPERPR